MSKVKARFNTSHVKVNPTSERFNPTAKAVSIHPMLKLIGNGKGSWESSVCFNTSHVKVNLKYLNNSRFDYISFNTSHVKVNLFRSFFKSVVSIVSIHPMLKLIKKCSMFIRRYCGFNTSHVKVNPCAALIVKLRA